MAQCSPCGQFKDVYQCGAELNIGTVPAGTYIVVITDLTSGFRRIVSKVLASEDVISVNISDLATDHTYRIEVEVASTQANQPFDIDGTDYTCGEFVIRQLEGDAPDEQNLIPKA